MQCLSHSEASQSVDMTSFTVSSNTEVLQMGFTVFRQFYKWGSQFPGSIYEWGSQFPGSVTNGVHSSSAVLQMGFTVLRQYYKWGSQFFGSITNGIRSSPAVLQMEFTIPRLNTKHETSIVEEKPPSSLSVPLRRLNGISSSLWGRQMVGLSNLPVVVVRLNYTQTRQKVTRMNK